MKLWRVRVTDGKSTVNVRRKSRGNRLWFELVTVRVIGSQLYCEISVSFKSRVLI